MSMNNDGTGEITAVASAVRYESDLKADSVRRYLSNIGNLAYSESRSLVDLIARLKAKQVTIGVIGLGYVGLPICIAIGEAGLRTLGFDVDPGKLLAINQGQSYFKHISGAQIRRLVETGAFTATSEFARLTEADVLLICVPTPLTAYLEPDLSSVTEAGRTIARYLRRGQLVILESTTSPGTSTTILRPILETSGLKCDQDFLLAFSPEREDPGNAEYSISHMPKVIGADCEAAQEAATAFYSHFVRRVVRVSSSATAEAVKLTENIFRAVNIALVNELKTIYEAMGIDVWEVIEAAKTKPFGFMPFYPGPGVGGHCIPVDPFYLTWKAREYGMTVRFIELAGQINSSMPQHVVHKVALALDTNAHRGLKGARILVVGIAYKKNIEDTRESPALRIIELLDRRGAQVTYYDPHVPVIAGAGEHGLTVDRRSRDWKPDEFASYDAVLIVTDHDDVDYHELVRNARLVVDTRNVCQREGLVSSHIIQA
jgi:UDP-N-acetyl-D-glucosamine dehydrogenase